MTDPPTPRSFQFAHSLVVIEPDKTYNGKYRISIPNLCIIGIEENKTMPEAELIATGIAVKIAQILDEYSGARKVAKGSTE